MKFWNNVMNGLKARKGEITKNKIAKPASPTNVANNSENCVTSKKI